MPPIAPKLAEGGWWNVIDDKRDDYFALEIQSGISKFFFSSASTSSNSCTYRLLLRGSNYEIARTSDKEQALRDWEWAQKKYEEEVQLVGATKLSDHHLLALFEALWEQEHPELFPSLDKKVIGTTLRYFLSCSPPSQTYQWNLRNFCLHSVCNWWSVADRREFVLPWAIWWYTSPLSKCQLTHCSRNAVRFGLQCSWRNSYLARLFLPQHSIKRWEESCS